MIQYHKCENCETIWDDEEIITPIPHLEERVAPGEEMPSGECPDCGAVCHAIETPAYLK